MTFDHLNIAMGEFLWRMRKISSTFDVQNTYLGEPNGPKSRERLPERQPGFTTSCIPLERLYTPLDVASLDYPINLGFPGEYPFTRGVQPSMYRGRFGPCASMPVSAPRRSPTSAIDIF